MQFGQRSAKIYQFPVRARTESTVGRKDIRSVDPRMIPGPEVLSGSGWYHEAAMQDVRRPAKQ